MLAAARLVAIRLRKAWAAFWRGGQKSLQAALDDVTAKMAAAAQASAS